MYTNQVLPLHSWIFRKTYILESKWQNPMIRISNQRKKKQQHVKQKRKPNLQVRSKVVIGAQIPQFYQSLGSDSSDPTWWLKHTAGQMGYRYSSKKKSREHVISGWWFQPSWKILCSQIRHLPQIRVKVKSIWNYHLDTFEKERPQFKSNPFHSALIPRGLQ